ncbi:MAG: hypothetical protein Fur0023_05580 [Bacteroidia bacterium]
MIEEVKNLLDKFKQVILYGPPGTGKTHLAKEVAEDLCGKKEDNKEDNKENKKEDNFSVVIFHPSYGYENFIEGIVPTIKNGHTHLPF